MHPIALHSHAYDTIAHTIYEFMEGLGVDNPKAFRKAALRTGYLSILASFVSLCASALSFAFIMILRIVHPLVFSLSRYPLLFVMIPAMGLPLAQVISRRWAKGIKGHGVPEIQYSVRDRNGYVPLKSAAAKTVASLITIMSGGSAGQAGPVALIGATAGSAAGTLFHLKPAERIILIGAGVASSVATLFHTPITALLFTLELILIEYSALSVIPVIVSTAVVMQVISLAGFSSPLIPVSLSLDFSPPLFLAVVMTLSFSALIAWGWMKVQFGIEAAFIRSTVPESLEAMVAGILVGTLSYLSFRVSGEHMVSAADTAFLQHLLNGSLTAPLILFLLFLMKFIANPLTLGAGGSGGVFAPSLFLGATAGAAVAGFVSTVYPLPPEAMILCALVGMSSVLAGVTGAVLTSIVLSVEITGAYSIISLVMISAALSYLLTRVMNRETLYSAKLKREEQAS